MTNNLRDLFAEEISDETAYQLGNFLYALALAFESAHLGQIKQYKKSKTELHNELMDQNSNPPMNTEKELEGPPTSFF